MYVEICTVRGAYLIHFGSYPKLESWINGVNTKYTTANKGKILEKLLNLDFLILPLLENLLYLRIIYRKKNNNLEIRVYPFPYQSSIQLQECELSLERIKQNIAIYHIDVVSK